MDANKKVGRDRWARLDRTEAGPAVPPYLQNFLDSRVPGNRTRRRKSVLVRYADREDDEGQARQKKAALQREGGVIVQETREPSFPGEKQLSREEHAVREFFAGGVG